MVYPGSLPVLPVLWPSCTTISCEWGYSLSSASKTEAYTRYNFSPLNFKILHFMKLMKMKGAAVAAFILGIFSFGNVAVAQQATPPAQQQQTQQNFSDNDLKQFAEANTRLMDVQKEGEQEMMKILEEEKLSVNKFNEMAMAHQQQKLNEVQATPEEMAAFNKAAQRMMELQPAMQKSVEEAIRKDGMTLEKYEQIMMAYRQDPALQERVNKMMEGNQQ